MRRVARIVPERKAADQKAKVDADFEGRSVEFIDQDEGRCADEGVHRSGRAAATDCVPDEGRRLQELAVVLGDRGRAHRPSDGSGLRQQPPEQQEIDYAQCAEGEKDGAPAERGRQGAADDGRHSRPKRHHEVHQREPARDIGRFRGVAHDGSAQREPRAAAKRLKQARGDEGVDGRREECGNACHGIEDQSRDQNRSAAEAIRDRSVSELADGHAENVETDRELHRADACAEIARRVGQRRHQHVHGDRAAQRKQRQQPKRYRRTGAARRVRRISGLRRQCNRPFCPFMKSAGLLGVTRHSALDHNSIGTKRRPTHGGILGRQPAT